MTAREKRLTNALRFVKACPGVYYGQTPDTIIKHMATAAEMALIEKRRKKAV